MSEREIPRHADLVDERLVAWFFLAALGYLFIAMLGGFLMGFQLVRVSPWAGIELSRRGAGE